MSASSDPGAALLKLVDDVLTERDFHGLEPRLARELQLAAGAITHERFRALIRAMGERLRDPD